MHRNDQSGRELQLTARNAQDIDIAIMKLFRVLYQRPDNLPVFNFAVKTGRGVQLWLRLESCAAVPMFTALYHDICVRLCAELQAVIEKNGIGLTVDTNASCDATRSVRLPFTHNSKRRDFVTEFVSLGQEKTLRQTVTLQALAQKYGVAPAQIPVAWAIAKGALPIIGVTKESHVLDALKAASITLSSEDAIGLEQLADSLKLNVIRFWGKEMK